MRNKIVSISFVPTGRDIPILAAKYFADVSEARVDSSAILKVSKDMDYCGVKLLKDSLIVFINESTSLVLTHGRHKIKNGFLSAGTVMVFSGEQLYKAKPLYLSSINGLDFKAGEWIWFHEDQSLSSGTMNDVTLIEGYLLEDESYVHFYKNGALESGKLAMKTTIQGTEFPPCTLFERNEAGIITQVSTETDIKIGDYLFAKNYGLWFHLNGQVKYGTISAPQKVNGINFPAETEFTFDDEGICTQADVDEFVFRDAGKEYPLFLEEAELNNTVIRLAQLYVYGQVTTGEEFSYKGVVYPAGSRCSFDGDNHVENIYVPTSLKTQKKTYPAGTEFWFRPSGTPYVPK